MEDKVSLILQEVGKVVKGKEQQLKKVLMTILAEGHILLEDVPGVGKTTIALAFSKVLGTDFNRIQFTPDVVPSDIIGFTLYDRAQEKFVFQEGAIMSNLILADEINRTSSRTQAALLEAMEEKKVTIDGKTYQLPKPFNVIATQNPLGSFGTQALPQSQLDRFMMKISIGYPDFDSQVAILRDRQTTNPLEDIQGVVSRRELLQMIEEVKQVHVAEEILFYITYLIEATRNHKHVVQGVSPRGALSLSKVAKARAYVDGRTFVTPEDVIDLFMETCKHRIVMDQKAQLTYEQDIDMLQEILQSVKTPDLISHEMGK
ncbi:AAA family ATPase [Pseudogracilibacillus sp. SO10305]|uniref:AAA family ATPase n=1 Tax=Pseudogracilibacillus sp. SO10305 TaxID=3098292 RepID=UPI00300DC2D3